MWTQPADLFCKIIQIYTLFYNKIIQAYTFSYDKIIQIWSIHWTFKIIYS